MSSTAVRYANGTNNFMMVSQHTAAAGPNDPTAIPITHMVNGNSGGILRRFLKAEPKALGTVQIMIGVITIIFGIIRTLHPLVVSTVTGVVFWAPVIYIISGSLSVAAENKLRSSLVKASLGMNVVSAVAAAIAVILLGFDFTFYLYFTCDPNYPSYNDCWQTSLIVSQSYGISGTLLLLSFCQCIISTTISIFACKATCDAEPMAQVVTVASPQGTRPIISPLTPGSSSQDVFMIVNPQNHSNPFANNPPPY